TLVIRDKDGKRLGERELESREKSCDSLKEQLALVVAVMIDPDAAMAPREPAPPPSSPPPAAAEPAPSTPPPPPPSPAPEPPPEPTAPTDPAKRDTWRLDGGAGLLGAVGLLPTTLGFTIGGILTPPGFVGLEGYGAYWLDTTRTIG